MANKFIDPFLDWSFKRLFSSEESKPVLIGFLNEVFKGRKRITSVEYGKTDCLTWRSMPI